MGPLVVEGWVVVEMAAAVTVGAQSVVDVMEVEE